MSLLYFILLAIYILSRFADCVFPEGFLFTISSTVNTFSVQNNLLGHLSDQVAYWLDIPLIC